MEHTLIGLYRKNLVGNSKYDIVQDAAWGLSYKVYYILVGG